MKLKDVKIGDKIVSISFSDKDNYNVSIRTGKVENININESGTNQTKAFSLSNVAKDQIDILRVIDTLTTEKLIYQNTDPEKDVDTLFTGDNEGKYNAKLKLKQEVVKYIKNIIDGMLK